ncbi:hypothetical protein CSC12_4602 [Klebsiella michiganensis]|nr:hypothetical protein A225_0855 [Klebsiella michiganensis E718]AWF54807.1 hypothetical protein CSC12_4602 [Klebsiella michiganensis]
MLNGAENICAPSPKQGSFSDTISAIIRDCDGSLSAAFY